MRIAQCSYATVCVAFEHNTLVRRHGRKPGEGSDIERSAIVPDWAVKNVVSACRWAPAPPGTVTRPLQNQGKICLHSGSRHATMLAVLRSEWSVSGSRKGRQAAANIKRRAARSAPSEYVEQCG